jgi:hypothetical protein
MIFQSANETTVKHSATSEYNFREITKACNKHFEKKITKCCLGHKKFLVAGKHQHSIFGI